MTENELKNAAAEAVDASIEEKIKKQEEYQQRTFLSPSDMASYILAGLGDKNWETFAGGRRFFYHTTFLRARPVTMGMADAVIAVADTLDNAISGPIIDRTRTRWGRVRPYLILSLPLWIISLVPWFLPGDLSQMGLFIFYTIFGYIGSIAASFHGPSFEAILFNITPNIDERNKLIAAEAYVFLTGGWIPSLFPLFVDFLPRTIPTRSIFIGGILFFSLTLIASRTYGFLKLRERVPLASREAMNEVSIWQSVKQLASCRPMIVIIVKSFFSMGKAVSTKVEDYFWLNNMGKLSLGALAGTFTGLPSYGVLPLGPKLVRKFGARKFGAAAYLFSAAVYAVMYIVGNKPSSSATLNFVWITIALTFAGAPNSLQRYASRTMQGDLYDYVEWKTGLRNEGTINAVMRYISLAADQVATILISFIIETIKYKPLLNEYGVIIPQTDPLMLKRIWTVLALPPAIGRALEGIAVLFFNVDGKLREEMMHDLAKIRAQKTVDSGGAE